MYSQWKNRIFVYNVLNKVFNFCHEIYTRWSMQLAVLSPNM